MTSLMKCVQFLSTGQASEVLVQAEKPVPVPDPGEVQIRMLASPVNPSDMMFIEGTYGTQPSLPQIPGFEGVGVVVANGGGFRGKMFQGKRVAVLNQKGGNWAEYVVVPAKQVIPLSSQLSVEQAATFFVNPATAWIMTQEVLKVPQDAWLLQTAAASSLGRMIVRLGKRMGFRTLNVVRKKSQVELLKAEGADEVVVFDAASNEPAELQDRVQSIVGADGLQFAIDPVGGLLGNAVIQTLSLGGRMLVFGTLSEHPMKISSRDLMTRHASVEGFWLGHFMQSKSLLFKLKLIKRLTKFILDGTLATEIGESFCLEDIAKATEQNTRAGKTILKIAEA